MKLRRLDLERFGHFRGPKLTFEGGPSMVLVHGDNEAGKTTVLEAIRWLLFGGNNGWLADGEASQLAVGARVELSNGSLIDIRRTKGRGGGLRGIGGAGDEIDEEWILARLSRPNRAVFENVFGFSLSGLAAGAKTLEHADLKNAIYGGGLGGAVQPDVILKDLQREREELFKEGGSKQHIHLKMKRIAEVSSRVTALTTRAEDWNRLQLEVEQRRAAATRAIEELRARRRETESLRARVEAHAPLLRADEARTELAGLQVPEGIPDDASLRHAASTASLASLEREVRELRSAIDEADAILAHPVDDALLAFEIEIDTLATGLARFLAASEERPRRASELEQLERRARDRLTALRPSWDLDRLRRFQVDAAARADLDAAINVAIALDAEESGLRASLRQLEDDLRANDASRAVLPEALEVAPLRAWLDGSRELAAQQTVLGSVLAEHRANERKRAALLGKLDPPVTGSLREVRVLREEELARFEREELDLSERLRHATAQRVQRATELAEIEAVLARADAEQHVPSEADLAAARARRDALLDQLVAALDVPRPDALALARSHDRAVRDADELADRMRVHADAVQRRAVAEATRARLVDAVSKLDASIAELAEERARFDARYRDAWAESGVLPRAPAAMRAWLATRDQLVVLEGELEESARRRDELLAAAARWEERGRTLLGSEASVDELQAIARERVAAEDRRARELEALERQRARDQPRLASVRAELEKLAAARARSAAQWPERLAALGLELDLSPAAARVLISGLVEARTELVHGEEPLSALLRRLDGEIAEYDSRARSLLTRVGADASTPLSIAVRELSVRISAARDATRARRDASLAREQAIRKLERLESEAAAHRDTLATLRAAAGAADDDAFRRVLADRARREELRRELASLEKRLEQRLERLQGARAPAESADQWLASVRALDRDAAVHELATADGELERIEDDVRKLEQDVGDARAKLQAVNGREDAAEALAALEAERAALRDDVERWSVLMLADSLLRSAITRFEREHQPALLGRASEIFRAMTAGRYLAVRRSGEGVAVERRDGSELSPEILSTGTREQLYLAIRLAYVEHYCRNAEPLPIVLDDVLVNFDDARARATLEALAAFGATTQVLLFTCHRSTITLAEQAGVAAATLQIPARSAS